MGHYVYGGPNSKKQQPRLYRPSKGRRASGLSPVNERSKNALRLWNMLRQSVRRTAQLQRNIRKKGTVTRGRFTVTNTPKKKTPKR